MREGVRLAVVAGRRGGVAHLVRVVMVGLVPLVFALLVALFAAGALLHFRHGRKPFLAGVLRALPPSAPAVRLSAARAKRVAGSGPGQRRKAVSGGEQRGLGGKASQVEVIWEEMREIHSVKMYFCVISGVGEGKRFCRVNQLCVVLR